MAVARTMCHVGTKSARPFVAPSSDPQWGLTLTKLCCPYFCRSTRRGRMIGRSCRFYRFFVLKLQGMEHHP